MEKTFENVAGNLFQKSSQEVYSDSGENIQRSVEKLVTKLVNEVGRTDNRYNVSEILKVGGFYEGTKIGKPDEFDFLVIIDELSSQGAVSVERHGPLHARVKFNDDTLQSRWTEFMQDESLRCFSAGRGQWGQGASFGERMVSVIKNLLDEESTEFSLSELIEVKDIGNATLHEFIDDDNLNLVRVVAGVPNILIGMEYNGMYLSADVSPAIRVQGLEENIDQDELIHVKLHTKIKSSKSLLLVTSMEQLDGVLFKVTFTEIEFALVKSMSQKGKMVYRYLKLLHHLCRKKLPYIDYRSKITSYILKTACIYQDIVLGNANCSGMQFLSAVLLYLYEGIHNKFLPSLFSRKHNLFKYKIFGNVKDLVATSKMEILLFAQVTQALLAEGDQQELGDKKIYSVISKCSKESVFMGYKNAHTCTHIKHLDSDFPFGSRFSSRRIIRFKPKSRPSRKMIALGPYYVKSSIKRARNLKRLG